ncbi:uncharacterized protein B0T15DRAFT_383200, partial [Chaetomium strumarium]
VNRLRHHREQDPQKNPAIKLLDFFTEKYDNDKPGRSGLTYLLQRTSLDSKVVRNGYDVIGSGLIKKTLDYWKTVW